MTKEPRLSEFRAADSTALNHSFPPQFRAFVPFFVCVDLPALLSYLPGDFTIPFFSLARGASHGESAPHVGPGRVVGTAVGGRRISAGRRQETRRPEGEGDPAAALQGAGADRRAAAKSVQGSVVVQSPNRRVGKEDQGPQGRGKGGTRKDPDRRPEDPAQGTPAGRGQGAEGQAGRKGQGA